MDHASHPPSFALRIKSALTRLLPAGLKHRLRGAWGWKWFRGDYPTWADASRASAGYGDAAILRRVLEATLQVKAGQAAFERDGVLFGDDAPDEALVMALDRVRDAMGGRLRVLDFGGSLGSTYWRHRARWPMSPDFRWDIVEQRSFVEAGRRHLADTALRFYFNASEAEAADRHDVLLCSGVLQYLENPGDMLVEWSRLRIPFLLLNNLPLHDGAPDRIRVQHVPPSIYPASYPVRFFNRDAFLAKLAPEYEIVMEFASEAVWPMGWRMYSSTGILLRRRASS